MQKAAWHHAMPETVTMPASCMLGVLQITMIVWQKLSSAREVLVEQELKYVLLSGRWLPSRHLVSAGNSSIVSLLAQHDAVSGTEGFRLPAWLSHVVPHRIRQPAQ